MIKYIYVVLILLIGLNCYGANTPGGMYNWWYLVGSSQDGIGNKATGDLTLNGGFTSDSLNSVTADITEATVDLLHVDDGTFTNITADYINLDQQQIVTVGKGTGFDYNLVNDAVAGITDASSSKQYTIAVYPGTYTECIDMTGKPYINLFGIGGRQSPVVLQCTAGINLQLGNTSNISISNIRFKTSGAATSIIQTPITSHSTYLFFNCSFQASPTDFMNALDLRNGMNRFNNCGFNYTENGNTSGAGFHRMIYLSNGDLQVRNSTITINVTDDNTSAVIAAIDSSATSTTTQHILSTVFDMKINSASWAGIATFLYNHGTSVDINLQNCHLDAMGGGNGTLYANALDSADNAGIANLTGNYINSTNFTSSYLSYVAAGDIIRGQFNYVNTTNPGTVGAGTSTCACSFQPGYFSLSNGLTAHSITADFINGGTVEAKVGNSTVDSDNFSGNLSPSDDTLQEIANAVDDLSTGSGGTLEILLSEAHENLYIPATGEEISMSYDSSETSLCFRLTNGDVYKLLAIKIYSIITDYVFDCTRSTATDFGEEPWNHSGTSSITDTAVTLDTTSGYSSFGVTMDDTYEYTFTGEFKPIETNFNFGIGFGNSETASGTEYYNLFATPSEISIYWNGGVTHDIVDSSISVNDTYYFKFNIVNVNTTSGTATGKYIVSSNEVDLIGSYQGEHDFSIDTYTFFRTTNASNNDYVIKYWQCSKEE